jgi:hypothetical protein
MPLVEADDTRIRDVLVPSIEEPTGLYTVFDEWIRMAPYYQRQMTREKVEAQKIMARRARRGGGPVCRACRKESSAVTPLIACKTCKKGYHNCCGNPKPRQA